MRSDRTAEEAAPPEGTAKDGARGTGPALEAHYRFLLWLVPMVERFPRSQKFLLGDRTQATVLGVLDSLIEATCTRQRGPHLACANLGLEKLRFLMRLAHDLGHPDHRRCEHAARCVDETVVWPPGATYLRMKHQVAEVDETGSSGHRRHGSLH